MPYVRKRLGYGGSAFIGSTQVLITGGSMDESVEIPYLNMVHTPPDETMAGRVQHADGTKSFSGSLSFDVNENALDLFRSSGGLLERFYEFDIGINDGESSWTMEKCKLTSLTLSGAVGGLVTAQISYISLRGKQYGAPSAAFIRDATPYGYWYTGVGSSDDVVEWTLNMTQDAQLVYTNENIMDPDYIKVGLVNYVLTVTSYNDVTPLDPMATLSVATKTFGLTGRTTGKGFSFGGLTSIGVYSYTFETSSQTGNSDETTLTIS